MIEVGNLTHRYGPVHAVRDLSRALELDPDHTDTWTNRAGLRMQNGDLEGAVDRGVTGAALSEEAARVFRSWRNDVAQRWVHSITYAGYHDSLLAGLVTAGVTEVVGVRHGHVCGECPAASSATWDPAGPPPEGTKIPPAHLDCTCTVTPPA